jgi:hypothetical protein
MQTMGRVFLAAPMRLRWALIREAMRHPKPLLRAAGLLPILHTPSVI